LEKSSKLEREILSVTVEVTINKTFRKLIETRGNLRNVLFEMNENNKNIK